MSDLLSSNMFISSPSPIITTVRNVILIWTVFLKLNCLKRQSPHLEPVFLCHDSGCKL